MQIKGLAVQSGGIIFSPVFPKSVIFSGTVTQHAALHVPHKKRWGKVLFLTTVKCRKMVIFAMEFPQNFLEFYVQM